MQLIHFKMTLIPFTVLAPLLTVLLVTFERKKLFQYKVNATAVSIWNDMMTLIKSEVMSLTYAITDHENEEEVGKHRHTT